MDTLEMILAGLVVAAGILAATATTIACDRLHAREQRDREIFRAYLDCPHEVEAWLVQGAMEQLEHALARQTERTRRAETQFPRRSADTAPVLAPPGVIAYAETRIGMIT